MPFSSRKQTDFLLLEPFICLASEGVCFIFERELKRECLSLWPRIDFQHCQFVFVFARCFGPFFFLIQLNHSLSLSISLSNSSIEYCHLREYSFQRLSPNQSFSLSLSIFGSLPRFLVPSPPILLIHKDSWQIKYSELTNVNCIISSILSRVCLCVCVCPCLDVRCALENAISDAFVL